MGIKRMILLTGAVIAASVLLHGTVSDGGVTNNNPCLTDTECEDTIMIEGDRRKCHALLAVR